MHLGERRMKGHLPVLTGPRGGFRLRSHHRREWDAQGAVPGLFDGKVSTMRQVLVIE